MAVKEVWIGTFGPFEFEDTEVYPDLTPRAGLFTTGKIIAAAVQRVTGLTGDRLVETNASKDLNSVADLTDYIAGGTGVDVTDDGDGTVTLDSNDGEIDHDSLNNTHNLTTDIDHDALTNFVAAEHVDWTSAPAATSLDLTAGAYFKPRRVRQSAQPTPEAGELLIWSDSDDDTVYLVYNDADAGVVQVQLS